MEKKFLFIALIILIILLINYFSKEEIIGKKIQDIKNVKISCNNKCFSDGIKQCSGNGYVVCKDYNKDGCLEWGNVNSCSNGCNNGGCIKELESLSDIPSYSYYKGWNLISLPAYILNPDKSIVFPSATSDALTYNQDYITENYLQVGKGYWLNFPSDKNIVIKGDQISDLTINLQEGWNLIGTISEPIKVNSIITNPQNIIISKYYWGTPKGYKEVDTLVPGKGYFVKAKQRGELKLSNLVPVQTTLFYEDFSSYALRNCLSDGSIFGQWEVVFNGRGCVKIENVNGNLLLHENPEVSNSQDKTASSLVSGPSFSNSIIYEARVYTEKQLRINSNPNSWEVAWVVWGYTDNDHFYYFILEQDGWELGKRDPNYYKGQRHLVTGSNPKFPIQNWYNVKIKQINHVDGYVTIIVYVDNNLITSFTDYERPYTSGKIGLYEEDSHVHFDDIIVTSI